MEDDILSGAIGGAVQGGATGNPYAALGGAALGIIGGIGSGKAKRAAEAERRRVQAIMDGLIVPTPEELTYILEELRSVGVYNPQLEGMAEQLGISALENVQVDPRLREQQMTALQQMSDIAEGGLTEADLADLRMASRDVDAAVNAEQQAIMQNMAMRGQATGGAELAARLQSSQSGANRRAEEYDRRLAQAQARALEGITQSSNMAGNLRTQDYDEQSRLAAARDAIEQFNLQQRAGTRQRDLERMNEAQLTNLGEKQRIADANVGTRNQQSMINRDALIDHYNAQNQKDLARAGVFNQNVSRYDQQAKTGLQNTQNMISGGVNLFATALNKPKAPTQTPAPAQPNAYGLNLPDMDWSKFGKK